MDTRQPYYTMWQKTEKKVLIRSLQTDDDNPNEWRIFHM
jgi:hypothetical protein